MSNLNPFSRGPMASWFRTRQEQRLAMALAIVIVCAGAYRVFATGKGLWASQYATIAALESKVHLLEKETQENDESMLAILNRQRVSLAVGQHTGCDSILCMAT